MTMSDDDALERAISALEALRGKFPDIEAQINQLRGLQSGAIAKAPAATVTVGDDGIAATYRAVASETISNSIVVTGRVEGGVYLGPKPHNAGEALTAYRRVLVASARHLPLRGIDVEAGDPSRTQQRLELAAVYIDLETRPSRVSLSIQPGQLRLVKTEQWSILTPPVLSSVVANRRLVLLGDPGSGKSTFINHLLLCLAAHGLDPEQGWLERLPCWPADEADLVPIPVLLRDFARSLPRERGESTANPLLLWRFIMKRLADQKLEAAGDALHSALDSGRAILLLDGLDEVPTQEERKRVRAIVDAIARRYPVARLIVTCRTLSYQDSASRLDGLLSAELMPFDESQIGRFIDAWYAELRRMGIVRPDEASPLALTLREAVRRKDLWRLAPNPLLLTVMALIHTYKGRLPDARSRLYEDTVDLLLWRWDELRTSGAGEERGLRKLLRDANCQDVDLHRTLWQLAYEAHSQADVAEGEVLTDIREHRLETALAQLHPQKSRDWAMQIIEVMQLRAGLLLERSPGIYTFPHRTFQEYLAGAHLAARANFATEASQRDVLQWREVILLAVGRLVYVNLEVDRPLLLAHALCSAELTHSEAHLRRILFAAEVLVEIGIDRALQVTQGLEIVDRLRSRLIAIMNDCEVSPKSRIKAGVWLNRVGDPRFNKELLWLPHDHSYGFVEIPEGTYTTPVRDPIEDVTAKLVWDLLPRKKRSKIESKLGDRSPKAGISDVSISDISDILDILLLQSIIDRYSISSRFTTRFFIARYPVTEAQFDVYALNTKLISTRKVRYGKNFPVVGVSFQEALSYCEWLTNRLRLISEGPFFRLFNSGWRLLPCSRFEWEKALFYKLSGRLFPWGNEEPHQEIHFVEYNHQDSNQADGSSVGIFSEAHPVGTFPEGRTPDGLDDLIGNVYEYMRDMEGRSVSGGRPLSTESLLEWPAKGPIVIGFRLALTNEPWTPSSDLNPPEPSASGHSTRFGG
jgi:Sulfatase-modifying factor enzyme 1/NACHT domain